MLAAHDGGMPLYDFTSLSCAQISEALAEGGSSPKVRHAPFCCIPAAACVLRPSWR